MENKNDIASGTNAADLSLESQRQSSTTANALDGDDGDVIEIERPPPRRRSKGTKAPTEDARGLWRTSGRPLSLILVVPILIVGLLLLTLGIILRTRYGEEHWPILLLREAGAVLTVVAVLHAVYEIVIHKVLHGDIVRLGVTVEDLQRTVGIVGGAVESGLAAVYGSRDEVNRAMIEEIEKLQPNSTMRLLGISCGAFLCPHGSLHGAFRKLLTRNDVTVEALILDTDSQAAVERASLEEPRAFAGIRARDEERVAYAATRCHNELKTATDFAQDLADRCYYRDFGDERASQEQRDAPNEPPVNARFSYRAYCHAPLCYLVIFEDFMFLESYHNAGRGGEAPVLKIGRYSGETAETTSLFRIYENHFKVMKSVSRDRAADLHATRASKFMRTA